MSFVGVFLEKEIHGKPFHIFTYLSQPDNLSSSGEVEVDNNLSLQEPRFICPNLRIKAEELKREEKDEVDLLINTSPLFPSDDQHVQSLLVSNEYSVCKHPLLPLFSCDNIKPRPFHFGTTSICGACRNPAFSTSYYLCVSCKCIFHKECVESPLEIITHPSYPSLSLQLYSATATFDTLTSCIVCGFYEYGITYRCPTSNLSMHTICVIKPIPILIDHPKRHPHTLTFFPKQKSLSCNVCGMIKEFIPTYVCARCVYVVHQDCIYFPYVIRISRHQHRISFTSSLPSGKWFCGICRKTVDNDCGAYTCDQCDGYFVHSRCALRKDLWDGEELEGVPEEPEIVVEPYEKIANGIILHFSHSHYLKLKMSLVYDVNKCCQACTLPIYEGTYYACVIHCDFILHEECANAPIKKHNPLHAHKLTIKVVTSGYGNKGHFRCQACLRKSNGFVYEKSIGKETFELDVRCASVAEPFKYEGHEHPLYLSLSSEEEKSAICQICHGKGHIYKDIRLLSCTECSFVLCFWCATLPYKAMYKHDKHFLTFMTMKGESDELDWCEACECKILNYKGSMYYVCDDYCSTTLHVNCLLGKDPYMKHDNTIVYFGDTLQILLNDTMTRPVCDNDKCKIRRCPYRVYFECKGFSYCNFRCSVYRIM